MRPTLLPLIFLGTFAAALVLSAPARARGAVTGNFILQECGAPDVTRVRLCEGYIAGAFDALFPGCLPAGVSYDQLTRVVVSYIRSRPEVSHEFAPFLIFNAVEEAFPC